MSTQRASEHGHKRTRDKRVINRPHPRCSPAAIAQRELLLPFHPPCLSPSPFGSQADSCDHAKPDLAGCLVCLGTTPGRSQAIPTGSSRCCCVSRAFRRSCAAAPAPLSHPNPRRIPCKQPTCEVLPAVSRTHHVDSLLSVVRRCPARRHRQDPSRILHRIPGTERAHGASQLSPGSVVSKAARSSGVCKQPALALRFVALLPALLLWSFSPPGRLQSRACPRGEAQRGCTVPPSPLQLLRGLTRGAVGEIKAPCLKCASGAVRHQEQSVLCFQEILSLFHIHAVPKNSYMTSPPEQHKLLQSSGSADKTPKTLSQHIRRG